MLLRNARSEDAQILIDFLHVTCGETRYLMKEPEKVHLTIEQEISFIEGHNKSDIIFLYLRLWMENMLVTVRLRLKLQAEDVCTGLV